jgi:large repetitive protein
MRKYILPLSLIVLILLPLTALAADEVKVNDFSATVTNGTAPLHVYFTGDVTGDITHWYWKFTNENTGKKTTSTANKTAVHNFNVPGVYDVKLTVWGPGGMANLTKTAYVTVNAAT